MIVFFGPTNNWRWDPSYYYAQLRSPIIDHDLNISHEVTPTRDDIIGSPWPIGPSLLWAPFFIIAHLSILALAPIKAEGIAFPYIVLVSMGSALYGVIAVLLIYKICRFFSGIMLASITSLLCVLATPLFFYIFHQPIMAHTTALFASASLVLSYLLIVRNKNLRSFSGLIFGVFLALNILTRWTGVLLIVLPLAYYLDLSISSLREKDFRELKFIALQILIMGATSLITLLPQFAFWYRTYGQPIVFPQGESSFVQSSFPIHAFDVIFSTKRGLVYWLPFIILCCLGLPRVPDRILRWSTILYLILLILVIGYRVDWYSGGGFGARYFIETLPLLSICFVCFWKGAIQNHTGRIIFFLVALVLVTHQLVLQESIEVFGWPEGYTIGNTVDLRWQFDSFLMILKNPRTLLLPRLLVSTERQTIFINIINGVHSLSAYRFTGLALILTPFMLIPVISIKRYLRPSHLPIISLLILGYLSLCALYLLIIITPVISS